MNNSATTWLMKLMARRRQQHAGRVRPPNTTESFQLRPCVLAWLAALAIGLLPAPTLGQAAGAYLLRGHVPPAIARFQLKPTGRLPATNTLRLAIGLPLRNQPELTSLLQRIYDPGSPDYHHYLTLQEFTERFGPTEDDYHALAAFAKARGLTVTSESANRMLLDVSGRVSDIEAAFHVTLRMYQHPTESRQFYAPDVEPSVDAPVSILHISGLDNYASSFPNHHVGPADVNGVPVVSSGSGSNGNYFGSDFRNAYVPGSTLTGTGQTVGLFEMDGYYLQDITNYESQAGIPLVPIQNILLDGMSGNPINTNYVQEASLDIEMAIAMAPGLSNVVVFEGNNWDDIVNSMATNSWIKQFSSSLGIIAGTADASLENSFQLMAAQGQSFFLASGDGDAFTGALMVPDDCTNITTVGGTILSMNGSGASYASETVWNAGYQGSGGGISTITAIPQYQQNLDLAAARGSRTMRNVPDVAMIGSGVWAIYENGVSNSVFGTSCAAPLWAGFTALVNQQAAANGQPPVGLLNPALYRVAGESIYASAFHDITTGNNAWGTLGSSGIAGSYDAFYACPGYDLCTGLGTPNGTNLINALLNPDPLVVTPGIGLAATGPLGGPFNAASQTFLLTNTGASALSWSVVNTSAWLNVSSGGGVLASHGWATVAVSLNSTASNMLAGTYAAGIWFSNVTSQVGQMRLCTLAVQSLVQNGGFETGDYTGWTFAGDGIVTNNQKLFVDDAVVGVNYELITDATNFIHSGLYGLALGDNKVAHLSQTLSTQPGQTYLLSFWMNNIGGQTPNQFTVNWITNATGTNILFSQVNVGAINTWSNYLFAVTATGTNTTLQFGVQNNQYFFGLDDISVLPVPPPRLSVPVQQGGAFALGWYSLPRIQYQVQYSTNLQGGWLPLGTNMGTNILDAFGDTNAMAGSPQKFYRLLTSP